MGSKIYFISFTFCLIIVFSFSTICVYPQNSKAQELPNSIEKLANPSDSPTSSLININNISSWVSQKGLHYWEVASTWNGEYPVSSNVGSIFTEGIVWGAKVDDGFSPTIRVSGNTYSSGCSAITRPYRVRPNYTNADLTVDAATFNKISTGNVTASDIQAIRDQYLTDWNEWPATEGAPFNDVNNDGVYEPDEDIPGVPGASQTLFIKYNDELSSALYGSPPIGLKITETYWAYSYSGAIGNVIYKKVNIIYVGTDSSNSNSQIDSMYIVQWSDPDVGSSSDDFAGCDTALNLGYAYNSKSTDATYSGIVMTPPAIGYRFLQGVSEYTGNSSDSSIFDFKWRRGYKYSNTKHMSSFVYFASGGSWDDPGYNYNGTLEFYNLMRGYKPEPPYPSGIPFPDEVVDYTLDGAYLLDGDPVTGTGKIDGNYESATDRRIMLINGPFSLKIGDPVEVVVALIGAVGNGYLNSVTKLKEYAVNADTTFLGMISPADTQVVDVKSSDIKNSTPYKFALNQNYPNPFNPTTAIKFSIPNIENASNQLVQLKIFDVVGNEIATLINEFKPAGNYEIDFDGSNLSSGIYFYQLKAGMLTQTKKMVLIK